MPLNIEIKDGTGSCSKTKVTSRGQLVTAPLEFSSAFGTTADVVNVAFNLVSPVPGKGFVVTAILLSANKGVGTNDASVQLYEASSATSTVVDSGVLDIEMEKRSSRDIASLNLLVPEGKWLNLKTNDATIFATIMGYFA